MQNDLQLSPGERRLGKEFGRSGLDRSDPARNKVEMGELLRQLISEGTFCKQYVISWQDLVAAGAVLTHEVALSEEGAQPDWLIAEDSFIVVEQEFAGAGVSAATLEVGTLKSPDPNALLLAQDVFTAVGMLGLAGDQKGAELLITTGQGKPTAVITDGLTATLRLTGGNMEDLTAGIARIVVLGRKAINTDALEIAPLT